MVYVALAKTFFFMCLNYIHAVHCYKNGDLRLEGGESEIQGRVEVYYDGRWGTICDDLWDDDDASVVCRQLGLSYNGTALFQAAFGRGSGTIWLDNVQCRGSEQSLQECSHPDWGSENCDHTEDAGVHCVNDGEIRLSGELNKGRIEVYHDGQWGTVCNDSWEEADAAVVCRQLGFNGSSSVISSRPFGYGSGAIWLDNVECLGSEKTIPECKHEGWGVHSCTHQDDVSIYCGYGDTNGDIRLANGSSHGEGRVELFHDGQWGTICDYGWNDTNAQVVCRQLGFNGSAVAVSSATFGKGSSSIWLSEVGCTGNEEMLHECTNSGWGSHNCSHSKDAGVQCFPNKSIEDASLNIRLTNGISSHEGRVEVFHDGQWGTVCDDGWEDADATVVCRQLGFNGSAAAYSSAAFGRGRGRIWLENVECSGKEESLQKCMHSGWGEHDCGHSEDAGVNCNGSDTKIDDEQEAPSPEIRLVQGSSQNEGRVEVYTNGSWGTVCDDGWDDKDAVVACRQLGLNTGGTALHQAAFGKGSGSILLDDVDCSGEENHIAECRRTAENDCSHDEDAGVRCNDVRLTHGKDLAEGRVEVYYDGQWGTVCDGSWTNIDAQIVCRQLGFGHGGTAVFHSFLSSTTKMRVHEVDCEGTETSLLHCKNTGWSDEKCSTDDVGVSCSEDTLSCLYSPCLNGGTCVTHTDIDVCLCTNDFHGNFCQMRNQPAVTRKRIVFPIFISLVCVLLVGVIVYIAFWIRKLKLSQDLQTLNYIAMRKRVTATKSSESSKNEYKRQETCRNPNPSGDREEFYVNDEHYEAF